jgi:Bacterial Ig domain/Glycosyl hydrolases family 16
VHTFSVFAKAGGVSGAAASVTWTVAVPSLDKTPPTVSISSPIAGATLSGVQTVSAAVSDNVGVASVAFYANGSLLGTASGATNSYSWDTTTVPDGTYSLTADGYDTAGNRGTTATPVNVTVINATASAADASGQTMPVGDVPGWHQVFADNFAGDNVPVGSFSGCSWPALVPITQLNCAGLAAYPSVEANWFAYPDRWPDTTHHGTYYPSKVISIQNGMMNLNLHTEAISGTTYHMVSAPVPKIPGGLSGLGGLLHGRYAVRFRADSLRGYKTAWLLWPDSNIWPANGEIDFPEGSLDGTIYGYMHWMNATSGSQQDAYPTAVTYNSWHTATLEWTPSYCRFSLDGNVIGTSYNLIPATPMHLVLQTETDTNGTTPDNTTAGNVQIDWAAAYTPTA